MGFADSVFRLFRENSDVVPLNRLKKQGVKNVTVLDWERVQKLIEKAVDQALSKHRIDLAPDVLATVHRDAKEAFHRLLAQRDKLEETTRTLEQERATLISNVEDLRSEIGRSQSALEEERRRRVNLEEITIDGDKLDAAMRSLEGRVAEMDGPTSPEFAARVAAVARSLIDTERQRAFEAAELEQKQKVENLERRLAKLQRTLSETEGVVEQLKAAKEGDPGIESIYKSVQGLDPKDQRATQKRGLLDQVFQLNLELREVIDKK